MPIDSAEKRPYYVLIETNNALEGKTVDRLELTNDRGNRITVHAVDGVIRIPEGRYVFESPFILRVRPRKKRKASMPFWAKPWRPST